MKESGLEINLQTANGLSAAERMSTATAQERLLLTELLESP